MLLVGSVGYAVVRGEAVWLVLFAARYALSPFVLGAVVCAALVVLGTLLSRGPSPPADGRGGAWPFAMGVPSSPETFD